MTAIALAPGGLAAAAAPNWIAPKPGPALQASLSAMETVLRQLQDLFAQSLQETRRKQAGLVPEQVRRRQAVFDDEGAAVRAAWTKRVIELRQQMVRQEEEVRRLKRQIGPGPSDPGRSIGRSPSGGSGESTETRRDHVRQP